MKPAVFPKDKKGVFFCITGLAGLFVWGAFTLAGGLDRQIQLKEETAQGRIRQEMEEKQAVDYIRILLENAEEIEKAEERIEDDGKAPPGKKDVQERQDTEGKEVSSPGLEWWDKNYWRDKEGRAMTPDYASGRMAFVLEYPDAGIRRGIYCGEDYSVIMHDFDLWMPVLFSPYMELGRTHLVILGHNHMEQDLSFNNIRRARIGDTFFLYAISGVYEYRVSDIFAMQRSGLNSEIVTAFDRWDKRDCFIVTCGRDDIFLPDGSSTRYRDVILHGKLVERTPLSVYASLAMDDAAAY